MGQATVDLPDPMDPTLHANASGTDDLLSQLAGDEIDRLLAEADGDRAAAAGPKIGGSSAQPSAAAADSVAAAPAPTPVTDIVSPPATASQPQSSEQPAAPMVDPTPPADELDALLSQIDQGEQSLKSSESPAAASPAAAGAPSDAPKPKTLTEQVPEVLAQFDASAAAAAAKPPTLAAPAAAAAPAPVAPPEPMEAVMSAAEREALGLSNLVAATVAAEQHDAAVAATTATATAAADAVVTVKSDEAAPSSATLSRFKLAIRLLEWMNVPLSFIPERMRDTLGKVGIVTLVNSIAVLIYVLFIRH